MKKLLLIISLLLIVFVGQSQIPFRQAIRYYNDVTFDKAPIMPYATGLNNPITLQQFQDSTYYFVKGTPWASMGYVTLTSLASAGYLTTTELNALGYVTGTPWTSMGYLTSVPVVTTIANGLMTYTDKIKLDSLSTGGGAGVADWTTLLNKPTQTAVTTTKVKTAKVTFTKFPNPVTYSQLTAASVYTGQTLANINGLSIPLEAEKYYDVEFTLSATVSADITGVSFGLYYNGGANATVMGYLQGSTSATASKFAPLTAFSTAISGYLTTSAVTGIITFNGIIYSGDTAQPLTVQYLKVTSGTITINPPSYLKVTLIK